MNNLFKVRMIADHLKSSDILISKRNNFLQMKRICVEKNFKKSFKTGSRIRRKERAFIYQLVDSVHKIMEPLIRNFPQRLDNIKTI